MATLNNIEKILQEKLTKAVQSLPTVLGNHAVNFTKDRFQKGGWQDESFEPWKERSPNAVRNKGRALLVLSGRLKRSVRVITTSQFRIEYGVMGVPYAAAHNQGFKGTVNVGAHKRAKFGKGNKQGSKKITGTSTVKAHTMKMNIPQRKFLGKSIFLQRQLSRVAAVHVARILKS